MNKGIYKAYIKRDKNILIFYKIYSKVLITS